MQKSSTIILGIVLPFCELCYALVLVGALQGLKIKDFTESYFELNPLEKEFEKDIERDLPENFFFCVDSKKVAFFNKPGVHTFVTGFEISYKRGTILVGSLSHSLSSILGYFPRLFNL